MKKLTERRMRRACAWCTPQRPLDDKGPIAVGEVVTHGICFECLEREMGKFRHELRAHTRARRLKRRASAEFRGRFLALEWIAELRFSRRPEEADISPPERVCPDESSGEGLGESGLG